MIAPPTHFLPFPPTPLYPFGWAYLPLGIGIGPGTAPDAHQMLRLLRRTACPGHARVNNLVAKACRSPADIIFYPLVLSTLSSLECIKKEGDSTHVVEPRGGEGEFGAPRCMPWSALVFAANTNLVEIILFARGQATWI
jgi:hypothetical protein